MPKTSKTTASEVVSLEGYEGRFEELAGYTAQFVRWRPDREPSSCTYEQLQEPVTYDLAEILT